MGPNGSRHVSGGGEFEGGRGPSYYGIADESAEFDDFRDDRLVAKWPKLRQQHSCRRVLQIRLERGEVGSDEIIIAYSEWI